MSIRLATVVPPFFTSLMLAAACAAQQHAAAPAPAPSATQESTTVLAPGLSYTADMTVKADRDFLRGYPSRQGDLVTAVVEIPAGATDKWEVKQDGVMHWDIKDGVPRRVAYLGYPCNYGIVPRAVLGKEMGGDGDPLDMLVLGPALPRGTVRGVKVLGMIKLIDAGEEDHKIIAVPTDSPLAKCETLKDLDEKFPGVTAILSTWFENYKGKGALQCKGFGDRDEAMKLVAACEKSFAAAETARTGGQPPK